jgi:hypothetical protein
MSFALHSLRRSAGLVAALLVVLSVASGLVYAQMEIGDYSQTNLGSLNQPEPQKQSNGATYSVDAYPLYRPTLEPGEGRELVDAYCSTCHSTRYITMQPPLPAATWEAEVNKMVKTFGQAIPEDTIPKITKYLQTHYTPETRKQ